MASFTHRSSTTANVLEDEQLKPMNVLAWVEQDGLTGLIPPSKVPGAPTASASASASVLRSE
jgi:hypothetical protein